MCSSLLHSVNLILFTLLLVHLILRISPHQSYHLCSHHLSLPRSFTSDINSSLSQILPSVVYLFLPDGARGSWNCTELSGHCSAHAIHSTVVSHAQFDRLQICYPVLHNATLWRQMNSKHIKISYLYLNTVLKCIIKTQSHVYLQYQQMHGIVGVAAWNAVLSNHHCWRCHTSCDRLTLGCVVIHHLSSVKPLTAWSSRIHLWCQPSHKCNRYGQLKPVSSQKLEQELVHTYTKSQYNNNTAQPILALRLNFWKNLLQKIYEYKKNKKYVICQESLEINTTCVHIQENKIQT